MRQPHLVPGAPAGGPVRPSPTPAETTARSQSQGRRSRRAKRDLEAVIALDAKIIGRQRDEYFKLKLKQALSDTGVMISLAVEIESVFAGYLLARLYYGEFGLMEKGKRLFF